MSSREEFMRQLGISVDDVKDPTNVKTKFPSKVTLEEGPVSSSSTSAAVRTGAGGYGNNTTNSSSSSKNTLSQSPSLSLSSGNNNHTNNNNSNLKYSGKSYSSSSAAPPSASGPGYMSYPEEHSAPQMSPMKKKQTAAPPPPPPPRGGGGGGHNSARDDFLRSLGIDNMETPPPPSAATNVVVPQQQQPQVASRASQEYARPGARPAAVCSQESDDSLENYRTMAPKAQPDVMLGLRRAASSMLPANPYSTTPQPSSTSYNKPFSMMDKDLDGLSAEEVKNLGNKSFEDGDFRKAVRLYSRAIEMDPRAAALYSNRSACYLQAAKQMGIDTRTMALRDADKVVEIRPDWFKGYSRRGDALFKLERFSEAAIAYERGLALDPDNGNLMHSLGEARNAAGGVGPRTQANSWSTKAVAPGEPSLRSASGKSAREMLEEMKTSMRREATECVMIGDDYREQELRRFRERPAEKQGSTSPQFSAMEAPLSSASSTSQVPRRSTPSTSFVDQTEREYARSNSRLDRSQIPEEFSSSVAAAYQQNLLEEYRRKKAAKNMSAAYQTY